jgi:hypothetical protein
MPRDLFAEQLKAPRDLFASQTAKTEQQDAIPFSRQLLTGLGQGTRNIIEGAAGLPAILYDPVAGMMNLAGANIPPLSTQVSQGLTAVGLPESPNDIASAVQRGAGGALTGYGVATALPKGLTLGGEAIRQAFASQPVAQTVAGVTGGASGEIARQSGAGPGGQFLASLLGSFGGAGATQLGTWGAGLVGKEGAKIINAMRPGAAQDIANQLYLRVYGGAPPPELAGKGVTSDQLARMQTAADMADQGLTADQIAARMNDPEMAEFVKDRLSVGGVKTKAKKAQTAQNVEMANKLAGAERLLTPAEQVAQREMQTRLLPESQAAIGGEIRGEAKTNIAALKTAASAEYDKAIALAGAKADDVSPLVSALQKIEDLPLLEWRKKPGELGDALRRFVPKETPGSDPLLRAMTGAADEAPAAIPPTATLETIDGLRRAVSSRQSKLFGASTPEALAERAALGKMKTVIDDFIAESNFPSEAKTQYVFANQNFADTVVPAAKTGLQPKIMSRWTDNQTQIVNEDIIPRMFSQGGEAETKNLINMIGPSQKGKDATARGVLETFRNVVAPQGERGPVNIDAAYKFLDNYRFQLDQLEQAGIRVRGVIDDTITRAEKATAKYEDFANQSKTLSELQTKVQDSPNSPTAMRTLKEANRAVQDVMDVLKDREKFGQLLRFGKRGEDLAEKATEAKSIKIPVTVYEEIAYNNVRKILSSRLETKLADKLGRELLDSTQMREAILRAREAAIAKGAPKTPLSKQLSIRGAELPIGINALSNSQNRNQSMPNSLLTPREAARMAEAAAGNSSQFGAP